LKYWLYDNCSFKAITINFNFLKLEKIRKIIFAGERNRLNIEKRKKKKGGIKKIVGCAKIIKLARKRFISKRNNWKVKIIAWRIFKAKKRRKREVTTIIKKRNRENG